MGLVPGRDPVHTVVHFPRMYSHSVLVVKAINRILMLGNSLLQCPARLFNIYRVAVFAGNLVHHTFLHLVWCLVLHPDKGLPQCASRLGDCLDVEESTDLLDPLSDAMYVGKKHHLFFLPFILSCALGWLTSGMAQNFGNGPSGKVVGLEDSLEMSPLPRLGSCVANLVSSVLEASDNPRQDSWVMVGLKMDVLICVHLLTEYRGTYTTAVSLH